MPKLLTDFNMTRISSMFSNFPKRMFAGEGFQVVVPSTGNQVCGEDTYYFHMINRSKFLHLPFVFLLWKDSELPTVLYFIEVMPLLLCAGNASNCLKDATCLRKVQIL